MISVWRFIKSGLVFYALAILFSLSHFIELSVFNISPESITQSLSRIHNLNVLLIIFFASVAETIFVFGYYFPGSLVLFTSFIVFQNTQLMTPIMWTTGVGIIVGCILNYLLGLFGSRVVDRLGHKQFIQGARRYFERFGHWGFLALAAHPNYCGTGFLVLGLLRIRAYKSFFVAIPSCIVFVYTWVQIFSLFPNAPHHDNSHAYIVVIFFVILGLIAGFAHRRLSR